MSLPAWHRTKIAAWNASRARFAASLEQGLSLTRGERVAINAAQRAGYPIALFGALRAGLIVVNVNPLYTADELAQQLADAQAKAIIVLENFAHTVERVLGQTALRYVIVTSIGDLLPFPHAPGGSYAASKEVTMATLNRRHDELEIALGIWLIASPCTTGTSRSCASRAPT